MQEDSSPEDDGFLRIRHASGLFDCEKKVKRMGDFEKDMFTCYGWCGRIVMWIEIINDRLF